jgi:Homoserine kinase
MRRVKVTLPAVATEIGPGQDGLGLALGLHAVVEFSERSDHQLVVDTRGEGAGRYSVGLQHPAVLGMIRVFQKLERASLGVNVVVDSQIPVESGLNAESAFHLAGVIGGSNLLGTPLSREQALAFAVETGGGVRSASPRPCWAGWWPLLPTMPALCTAGWPPPP